MKQELEERIATIETLLRYLFHRIPIIWSEGDPPHVKQAAKEAQEAEKKLYGLK